MAGESLVGLPFRLLLGRSTGRPSAFQPGEVRQQGNVHGQGHLIGHDRFIIILIQQPRDRFPLVSEKLQTQATD